LVHEQLCSRWRGLRSHSARWLELGSAL